MKCSKRAWWNGVLRGLTGLAIGVGCWSAADAAPPAKRAARVPMRLASQLEEEPLSADDAAADDAAPAETMEEPEAAGPATRPPAARRPAPQAVETETWYDDEMPGAGRSDYRRLWGPVWYGDCGDRGACRNDCPPRWWAQAEYLLWFQQGMDLPALVTSSFQGTQLDNAGVLGEASTTVVYGQDTVGNTAQSGARLTVGRWLDDCEIVGVGGRGFILEQQGDVFTADEDSHPILARPYLDVSDGQPAEQNALVLAFPNLQTGSVSVTSTSDVSGGDFFLRRQIYTSHLSRVDLWVGYQYSRLSGDLTIDSQTRDDSGAELEVFDQFATRNEFHGGTLGLVFNYERPRWRCEILTKVGLGRMHQSATLRGSNSLDSEGGLLVRTTNDGTRSTDTFAVSPEFGLTGAWRLTPNMDLTFGYSFLYWSDVLTPPGAIDRDLAVNLNSPPVIQRPAFSSREGDYWVQGLNFGLVARF